MGIVFIQHDPGNKPDLHHGHHIPFLFQSLQCQAKFRNPLVLVSLQVNASEQKCRISKLRSEIGTNTCLGVNFVI